MLNFHIAVTKFIIKVTILTYEICKMTSIELLKIFAIGKSYCCGIE